MSVYRTHRGYIHDLCDFQTTGRDGRHSPIIEGIRAGMPRGERCYSCGRAGAKAPGDAAKK